MWCAGSRGRRIVIIARIRMTLGNAICIRPFHAGAHNHLAQQARAKHLRAKQDEQQPQQKQWTIAQWVSKDQLFDGEPQAHDKSGDETECAYAAEEVHRAGGEAREK